jgi:hypothetical protein
MTGGDPRLGIDPSSACSCPLCVYETISLTTVLA